MNDLQKAFLAHAAAEADRARHPFPEMAASEAALESGWGNSALVRDDNNLFGMKQHVHPICGTVNLPTQEFLDGKWVACSALWVKYPDWISCFADRLATLQRLSNRYPHYAAALGAQNAVAFVTEVSKSWSTDPNRAQKVISIYNAWKTSTQSNESSSGGKQ